MVLKHVLEAAFDSDFFGGPSPDTRAILLMRERANHCIRVLTKLGMSKEGAGGAVRKALKSETLLYCASPIEQCMMAGLIFADYRPLMTIPALVKPPAQKRWPKGDVIIAPQFAFGPYRLDFLVIGKDNFGGQKWIDVECDGEEHHATCSMAKWESDRERDKFIEGAGIEVIRFTGSDIWKQPAACADEAASLIVDWLRTEQTRTEPMRTDALLDRAITG